MSFNQAPDLGPECDVCMIEIFTEMSNDQMQWFWSDFTKMLFKKYSGKTLHKLAHLSDTVKLHTSQSKTDEKVSSNL